ncbi:carbohydrate kinase family protein [Runella aurantiaca]|uniref:Carbohydrate kinase n=1 Tax=Runella aurantiaca TaxID=2282308 RepID=A0A369I5Y7_9BACT|nr:carbohydrate kinase [Runella aurantiaca]RDB05221.1 carbohydrate kinase [Runella aurantiaca]
MKTNIICFGEMLWDVLPTGKQPGGAPMNVAVHLKNLGHNPQMISRIGHDELGKELLDFIEEKGLTTDLIQQGETHLTGVVKANVSDKNEVTYKIVQPVAWDYIQCDDALETTVANADVFVYGSLAARSAASADTLFRLLKKARFKVFDINLRAPHYDQNTLEQLLRAADMVKMNANELDMLAAWYAPNADEQTAIITLAETFDIQTICVTKGEHGAVLWTGGKFYQSAGFQVDVQDTIGSGDSFLAALLTCLLEGQSPADGLQFACAMGSLVATYRGATPFVTASEIHSFLTPQIQ